MFYIFNVQKWLNEVLSACFENHLNPEDSVFALLIFSSLDFEFVAFFRDRKPQISQYSGRNVHIFTSMIFDEDVVPDDEWRLIKDGFSEAGIRINNRPLAILFHLRKRAETTGYDPHCFAGFQLPAFSLFETRLRDFIDACISHRQDGDLLARELGILFGAPNLVHHIDRDTPLSGCPITDVLHAPKVFISYAHGDKQSVLELYSLLNVGQAKLWLDQFELYPGELIQQEIEKALRSSDA